MTKENNADRGNFTHRPSLAELEAIIADESGYEHGEGVWRSPSVVGMRATIARLETDFVWCGRAEERWGVHLRLGDEQESFCLHQPEVGDAADIAARMIRDAASIHATGASCREEDEWGVRRAMTPLEKATWHLGLRLVRWVEVETQG